MRSLLLRGIVCALVVGLAAGASAEPYVAGYVGGSIPFDQDIVAENPLDTAFTELEPDDSVVVGARGGFWLDNFPYLGIEANIQVWFPDIDQTIVVTTQVGTLDEETDVVQLSAEVDAISVGVVALGRFPIGDFVPYGGGGIAWQHVDFSQVTINGLDVRADDDLFPAVQVQGGAKYYITPNIALFAEYMFTTKRFDTTIGLDGMDPNELQTIEVDFDNQFVHGGIEYRFWEPTFP